VGTEDGGKDFHYFLMFNGQRRLLTEHFEDLHIHRVLLQLPFFDSVFLESVLALPLDGLVRHRFYNKWLTTFDPAVAGTPWQAYPGHEAMRPDPDARALLYQWAPRREAPAVRLHRSWRSARLALDPRFPSAMCSRAVTLSAAVLHALGIRDCGHIFDAAHTYADAARHP
jgi:hypothetical protein